MDSLWCNGFFLAGGKLLDAFEWMVESCTTASLIDVRAQLMLLDIQWLTVDSFSEQDLVHC